MEKQSTSTHKKSKTTQQQRESNFPWPVTVFVLLLWTAAVFIASQYVVTLTMYFVLGRDQLITPVWLTVCNALVYALTTFLAIWIPTRFFKMKRPTRNEIGLKGYPTWADIGLAPAGFVVYFVLAAILITIFSYFPFFNADEAQELGYSFLNSGIDRLVAFFALCIVAPIAEEIVFRGWLYDRLRTAIPNKRVSLFLSILLVSTLFGIMHGQWNVGVNVFALSVVLCGLREVTGTIYSGILLHILKNAVAFAFVYIFNMS